MLSRLFKTKPVIDESSKAWIYDTFSWCIEQLDGDFFKNNSELILPNNRFYPGSASSVEAMADKIFANTLNYTGMKAWPLKLVSHEHFIKKNMPPLAFTSRFRGDDAKVSVQSSNSVNYNVEGQAVTTNLEPNIEIAFHASQLNQPQDLIAYLVQVQAGILVTQLGAINPAISKAPGGSEVLPQTIDLIACFMGFGVIFANTAYQFKGGCGSCNNRNLNRQAALPELETVYALALFCVIKGVDIKPVKKQLKSHLYKPFRQAYKEISVYLQQTNNPEHARLISTIDS